MFSKAKQVYLNGDCKNESMSYGSRMQQAMDFRQRDRAWVCAQMGVSVQAVSSVLIGHTKSLKAENHEKLCRALAIDSLWLATGEGEMERTTEGWPFRDIDKYRYLLLNDKAQWTCEMRFLDEIVVQERVLLRNGTSN